MKVQMLTNTTYNGPKIEGEEYEVSKEVAKRWHIAGIALIIEEEKVPEEDTPEEEETQEEETQSTPRKKRRG